MRVLAEAVVDNVWNAPMVEGKPEGTVFYHGCDDAGLWARLSTHPNVHVFMRVLGKRDLPRLEREAEMIDLLDKRMNRLRDVHELAYEYNIFPDWRF